LADENREAELHIVVLSYTNLLQKQHVKTVFGKHLLEGVCIRLTPT